MGSFISKHLTLFKSKLLYPFQKGLRLFILIFFISSSVECWGFATFETFTKAIYIAMHHAVVASVVTFQKKKYLHMDFILWYMSHKIAKTVYGHIVRTIIYELYY